jgi:hypothetical protein
MDNTQKAVRLLEDALSYARADNSIMSITPIATAIALLSPPPLSKEGRIARELDILANYMGGVPQESLHNIAAILREGGK